MADRTRSDIALIAHPGSSFGNGVFNVNGVAVDTSKFDTTKTTIVYKDGTIEVRDGSA